MRFPIVILALLSLFIGLQAPALAYTVSEEYVTPEVKHQKDLAQKLRFSKQVNVNRASLNELQALPGIDENLALKMMRIRPIEGIRDFQRLPWVSQKEVQQLMQNLQNRVSF